MQRGPRAAAASAAWLLLAACLLTHQVAGRHLARRSLFDEDLISTGLSMISGQTSCGCKQLTLCDLATVLLQAVEANKAQDVETFRRREQSPSQLPSMGFGGRFRRAGEVKEDSPPHPTLLRIARSFLHSAKEEEAARRAEAVRKAKQTLAEADRQPFDVVDDDEPPRPTEESKSVVQKIS